MVPPAREVLSHSQIALWRPQQRAPTEGGPIPEVATEGWLQLAHQGARQVAHRVNEAGFRRHGYAAIFRIRPHEISEALIKTVAPHLTFHFAEGSPGPTMR